MEAHLHEFAEQVENFLILPPGARDVGEAVGNAFPNQIYRIPASAPDNRVSPKSKGLTFFLSPQIINQCEHAACIGESSLC